MTCLQLQLTDLEKPLASSETSYIEASQSLRISCKVCEKQIDKKKMRWHVRAHILRDDLKNACGFCGLIGKCDIKIVKGSGKGQTASEVPKSACDYFEIFSIVAAGKGSKRSCWLYVRQERSQALVLFITPSCTVSQYMMKAECRQKEH